MRKSGGNDVYHGFAIHELVLGTHNVSKGACILQGRIELYVAVIIVLLDWITFKDGLDNRSQSIFGALVKPIQF